MVEEGEARGAGSGMSSASGCSSRSRRCIMPHLRIMFMIRSCGHMPIARADSPPPLRQVIGLWILFALPVWTGAYMQVRRAREIPKQRDKRQTETETERSDTDRARETRDRDMHRQRDKRQRQTERQRDTRQRQRDTRHETEAERVQWGGGPPHPATPNTQAPCHPQP